MWVSLVGGRKALLTVYHFFIILLRVIIGCYIHLETSLCGFKKERIKTMQNYVFLNSKSIKKNNMTHRTFPRVQCTKHVKCIKMWKPYTFHYIILQLSFISFWYKSNFSEHNSIHFLSPAPALQLQSTSVQINHAKMAILLHQE